MAEYIMTVTQIRKDNEQLQNKNDEMLNGYIKKCKVISDLTGVNLIEIIKKDNLSKDMEQACIERIEAEMVVH